MHSLNQTLETIQCEINWPDLLTIVESYLQSDTRGIQILKGEIAPLSKMLIVQYLLRLGDEEVFWISQDSRSTAQFIGSPLPSARDYKSFRQVFNDTFGIAPFFAELARQLHTKGLDLIRGCHTSPYLTSYAENAALDGVSYQNFSQPELQKGPTELRSIVNSYVKTEKAQRPYSMEKFSDECGFRYKKSLNRLLNGERLASLIELENLAKVLERKPLEVERLLYNPYQHFKIKHLNNPSKAAKSLAGKTCWNPKINAWEYQIVLYNELDTAPDFTHEVWEALRHTRVPSREGYVAWETGVYLLYELK